MKLDSHHPQRTETVVLARTLRALALRMRRMREDRGHFRLCLHLHDWIEAELRRRADAAMRSVVNRGLA